MKGKRFGGQNDGAPSQDPPPPPTAVAAEDEEVGLNQAIGEFGLFCYLERQTGVNKTLLAILLVAATCYLSIKFFGVAKVINFVVFVWPAYSTYKVLEGSNLDEHLFWLKYWVVYGFFYCLESVSDLFLFWLPYYVPIKLSLLTLCLFPYSNACVFVYDIIVRPFLLERKETIDRSLDTVQKNVWRAGGEIRSVSADLLRSAAAGVAAAALASVQKPPASSSSGAMVGAEPGSRASAHGRKRE